MKIFKFLLILSFNFCSSQLISDYKLFAKKLEIGEYNFKDVNYNFTQNIIYLGKITSKNNNTFKVLTSHKSLDGKGINDLIFISEKDDIYIYRLDLPTDFPTQIKNNELYFKENKKISINKLLNIFCTPFECFEKI